MNETAKAGANAAPYNGVGAPLGFTAAGVYCGVKRAGYPTNTVSAGAILGNENLQDEHKPDLALIYCDVPCNTAAVFTQNLFSGAPVTVCKEHLAAGKGIRAVIANSGNANTCNADGIEKANMMCRLTAEAFGIAEDEVLCASTGVIGNILPIEPIAEGIPYLKKKLSKDGTPAARAIMTTDTVVKQITREIYIDGKKVTIGAMSKGSGMIHPNMATMLAFITTDAAISSDMLRKALKSAVRDSFNMLSVDGDTSTNDTLCVMASGLAGNKEITEDDADYAVFASEIYDICIELARMMAKDGEGATKLIECAVTGAADPYSAKIVAKAVICSPLVKSMIFGCDANVGRVLCAIGNSNAVVSDNVSVAISSANGTELLARGGYTVPFSEENAKKVLEADEIVIEVTLGDGNDPDFSARAFGCDLTYDYVKINGDYRT